MEIKDNSKGRGLYATKEYQPWDVIHVESAIFSNSSICNKEYMEIARKTKDLHVEGSFINRMLTFIARAPDDKIKIQHPHIKFPLIYLLNGGKVEKLSHLARAPNLGVTDNQIKKVARTFKVNKDDLKLLAQVLTQNLYLKDIN